MTHRFIGNFPLEAKQFWIADDELTHQVREVLRLTLGEEIILSDGRGQEATAEIVSFDKKAVEVKILSVGAGESEPGVKVTLYLAILKRENFELAVQKSVESGASKIVPIITERTVKLGFKRERLEKIIKEAAEQSGRSFLPVLGEEMKFKDALKDSKLNDANVFFDLGGKSLAFSGKPRTVGVFVGPEGGWTEMEAGQAKVDGATIAGLGRLTLRAETAAIVAVHEVITYLSK